jgi:hypothetical protein
MRSLKDFIGKRNGSTHSTPIDDKTVFFIFRKMIREEYGTRGSAELEPVAFAEGILSIKANNPLYSSELWVRRETIRERMNVALEQDAVQELRLVRYAP